MKTERREMKTRFYVAYDAGDPSEAEICSILAGLGRRRAELVRALILHAVRSYGRAVLREENLDVLFYLMKEEEENVVRGRCPYQGHITLSEAYSHDPHEPQRQKLAEGV